MNSENMSNIYFQIISPSKKHFKLKSQAKQSGAIDAYAGPRSGPIDAFRGPQSGAIDTVGGSRSEPIDSF
jgi:hypothetical protein